MDEKIGYVFGVIFEKDEIISYIDYSYSKSLKTIKFKVKSKFPDRDFFRILILDAFYSKNKTFDKKITGMKHRDNLVIEFSPPLNGKEILFEDEWCDKQIQLQETVKRLVKGKEKKQRKRLNELLKK